MSLPNLENSGWQPGAYWAAEGPEQQHELDIRYRAEEAADNVRAMRQNWFAEAPDMLEAPYDREESVQNMVALIQSEESYRNRPLSAIVKDTISWIDEARKEPETYDRYEYALDREADSLLTRITETDSSREDIDPELLALTARWASLAFFIYRHYRAWTVDDHDQKSAVELIEKAGISRDELRRLCQAPLNVEAQRLHDEEGYDIAAANQSVTEAKLLELAHEEDIKLGKAHGYAIYLGALGL